MDFIKKHRADIREFLSRYFINKSAEFKEINQWGEDAADRLLEFILRGKMVRGSLIMLAHEAFGGQSRTESAKAAAAMELFQSSILIHDDIIDRDDLRRGLPSMHHQYENWAKQQGLSSPGHFGLSLATCVADIGFFMSMEILNCMDIDRQLKQKIISIFYREVMHVGLAEMQDVHFEYDSKEAGEDDILRMYKYKTANYTFSLPLKIGAISAGASKEQIKLLDRIGEYLGIAFQIKDDELGIYGAEEKIGKSTGIDIRDNKKTIYRHHLMQASSKQEIMRLDRLFGNRHLNEQDLAYVQELLKAKGIYEQLQTKIKELEEQARKLIGQLDIKPAVQSALLTLVDYNTNRQK